MFLIEMQNLNSLNLNYIKVSKLIYFFNIEIKIKNSFSCKTDPSTTNGHFFEGIYGKWKSNCIKDMGVFNPCIYMCIKIAWKNHRDFPLIEFQKTQCNMCWWWSSLEWVTLLLQTCGSLQRSSAKSWDWITVFMGEF